MSRKTGSRGRRELTEQQKIYERRIRSGYGRYIIPGALGTIVVLLIPFVANILISCTNWRGGRSKMKWIGFDNYARLFQDEKFWTSFGNSLYMLGLSETPDWLGDPDLAIYAVMLMLIWSQIGYPVVIFMSALGRVDPELYEAAALDGAGWWRRFTAITLPQIKPEIFVVVLTCTVAALKVFGPVYMLTKGGPQSSTLVPSYYSYINFFGKSQIGYGAAISSVLAIVIAIVASVILVFQNRSAARERAGALIA